MIKIFLFAFIGAFTSISIVQLFKKTMFNRNWSYPLLLASFPVFYLIFSLWINDKTVLKNEFYAGLLFFCIAIVYIRYPKRWVEYLLIAGFIFHALYDITHDLFFLNMGVPIWWPGICGSVNLFIGLYLLFLLRRRSS